jgi:CDP-6-deoxy-D-xylo-4-hexulose-3-dehydrase
MNNVFWIGVYPGLTTEMLDYVVETISLFVDGAGSGQNPLNVIAEQSS